MPSVLLALLLMVGSILGTAVRLLVATGAARYSAVFDITFEAVDTAALILLASGIRELASGLAGTQRIGAKLAETAAWGRVGVGLLAATVVHLSPEGANVAAWLAFALTVLIAVGLITAAGAWRSPIGGLLPLVVLIGTLPPLRRHLRDLAAADAWSLNAFTSLMFVAGLGLLARRLAREATAAQPPRLRDGFALSSTALLLRMFGVLILLGAVSIAGGTRGRDALFVTIMVAPITATITSAMFGVGLLRVARATRDAARWLCLGGAAGAFWVLSIGAQVLPRVHAAYDGKVRFAASSGYPDAFFLPTAGVTLVSVLLGLVGIATLARVRGETKLVARTHRISALILVTALASILLTASLLPDERGWGSVLPVILWTGLLDIVAVVAAQRVFSRAATAVDATPLPAARVVD